MKKPNFKLTLGSLIILIALFVSVPKQKQATDFDLLQECGANLSILLQACSRYEADHGSLPQRVGDLKVELHCPISGLEYKIDPGKRWDEFVVYCPGSHHISLSHEPNYPRYGFGYPSGPQLSSRLTSAMNLPDSDFKL